MSVRPAVEADIPRLLGYAEQFLAYHPMMRALPRDLGAIEATLRRMMTSDEAVLLVHDRGVIGGVLSPVWASPSVLVATELFWWAELGGRPLMKAFETWAQSKGASVVNMIAIMGERDVTPIYDRAGYVPTELSFVRAA